MPAVKKNVFIAVLKLSKDAELRTEHGNRFHAAGPATTNAHPPNFVLVRWTVRSPWADDRVRPSRLQHWNFRRARINMQGPVHASLCTSSDTVWTGCAVPQAVNVADHESSRWRASIFLHRKASLRQHSSHAACLVTNCISLSHFLDFDQNSVIFPTCHVAVQKCCKIYMKSCKKLPDIITPFKAHQYHSYPNLIITILSRMSKFSISRNLHIYTTA